MRVELRKPLKVSDIDVGTTFIARTNDVEQIEFIAMKINCPDEKSDENIFVLDMKNSIAYDDIKKYDVIRIIDCRLVEINDNEDKVEAVED